MGGSGQRRLDGTVDGNVELKASVYRFANGGLVGLFLWTFGRNIDDALARYLTIAVAMAAWLGALVVLALANRNGLTLLRDISVYVVIGMPLLGLVAWVSRHHRDALAAEHGRDSEAYDKAIEARHRDAAKTAMQDDWVLDPPWQRRDKTQKPRFGRQGQ